MDEAEEAGAPRVLFAVESEVTDGRLTREGRRRVASRRVEYIEVDEDGDAVLAGPAPYLDYRPLRDDEREAAAAYLSASWIDVDIEEAARNKGIEAVVLPHLEEVRATREELVAKAQAAVQARLTSEIHYWDARAMVLKEQEDAGRKPRLNSANARRRCEELEARLEARMRALALERDIAAQPPVVHGGALVLPAHLLRTGRRVADGVDIEEKRRIEAVAMAAVLAHETAAGRDAVDVSRLNRGWDIESREPGGRLRYIEVKGRRLGADTVTVTKNELFYCLNKRDQYYLAVVLVDGERAVELHMKPDPLRGYWAFALTSQTLDLKTLLAEG